MCGNKHKLNECPGKNQENCVTKCINCSGTHAANYGGCLKIQKAKQIEKIRAEKRLFHSAAVKSLKESNNQGNAVPNAQSNLPALAPRLNSHAQIWYNLIVD